MPVAPPEGDQQRFVTTEQLMQEVSCFSLGRLKWLLYQRRENGLDKVVHKVGKRLYVDLPGFLAWMREHNDRGEKV